MLYFVLDLLLYDLSDCLDGRFQFVDDFVEAALLTIEERFSDSRTIDKLGTFFFFFLSGAGFIWLSFRK